MYYDPNRLLLISGPCVAESEDLCHQVAQILKGLQDRFPHLQVVFKASFDKANRSALGSPRGPGLAEGLKILESVRTQWGLPVTTDVHECAQVQSVASVCEVLQIPAFLCRQTDLLQAAAATGRVVNVKKGQFLAPGDMRFVQEKLKGAALGCEVWQTERGTTFGYQNLVVDMRAFPIMQAHGRPVIFDATHSVQLPGTGAGVTLGERSFVPPLARAALAAGADGLFIEAHPHPDQAWSDRASQWPLDQLDALIEPCLRLWRAVRALSTQPQEAGS